jgi:small subunit ribosomal protein S21
MIYIDVKKEGSLDKALKKLKSKFKSSKIAEECKQRSYFEKPSVTRRNEVKKAEYRQSKFQQSE